MATLEQIANKIDGLRGDMTYRKVMDRELNYLEAGRRANHEFVVRTNMRTLRSGPNRGKVRVDGVVVVMYGNRDRTQVETAVVRQSARLLPVLDKLSTNLTVMGY